MFDCLFSFIKRNRLIGTALAVCMGYLLARFILMFFRYIYESASDKPGLLGFVAFLGIVLLTALFSRALYKSLAGGRC